jgi:tape measure domain-containing protein
MGLEVEVVSDSARARKDLKALEEAINNIKKVAANFSFNPFSEKSRENTRRAAEDLEKLKENSKAASSHFSKLAPDSKVVSESIKNTSQSYEKAAKHADTLSKETKNISVNLKETSKQSSVLEKSTNAAVDAFKNLAVQIGATAAAYLSMKTYLSATDTTVSITSKISVATATQADFNRVLKETRNIAISTRGGLVEITDLYTKLNLATQNFNRSQEDVGRVTSTVAKAVALSGSSAESAAAAVMQLGQAFSSGILQGDELRSISENASQLMQTIADGFGKTTGQIRQLGAEGKLTSEKLFQSILSQTEVVNGRFSKIGVTFGQAFTNISSSTLILFAELERVLSGAGGAGGAGGAKGIPYYINNIALEIAKFAENIGYNITMLKVRALLLVMDIRKFLSEPFDIKLKATKLAVEDILPSQAEIYNVLTSAVTNAKSFMASVMGAVTPTKKASGGYISGPGTGTSDSIPAMLSNGEFVVNAEATRKNLKLLSLINSGAIKHFAKGGAVDSSSSSAENWLYRSIPQKPTTASPLPVAVVSQNPAVAQIHETLLFDRIQESLIHFFKQAANNIKKVTDPMFVRVGNGLDSFVSKLEKWIPGLTRTIDIFKSLSGIGPYTGGGPQRNSDNRMFGHDVLNTFVPVRAQIPVLATITAAAGALIALSTTGTVRSVLLGLLTTAFGLTVGGTVYDSEIKRVNGILMKTGIDIVHGITNALFGSGIFGDRGFGGTLALIAKMSLLFSAGRSFMGNMAVGLATAPTTLANSAALATQAWYASRVTDKVQREYESLEKVGVRLKEQKDTTFKELSAFGSNGIKVGPANARIISEGLIPQSMSGLMPGIGQRGTNAQREFMGLAGSARNATEALELYKRTQEQQLKELKKNLDALKSHSDGLQAAVKTQKENFKTGVINTAGGIGGTFGALGGFNVGIKVADGMKDANEWQKSATIITSTMIGQAILAGIGSISATIAVAIFSWAGPTLLAIAAIAATVAAVVALYKNWDTVVDKLNKVLNEQLPLWIDIGKQWTKQLANFVLDAIGAPRPDSKFVSEFKSSGGFKTNAPYGLQVDSEKHPITSSIVTIASNIGSSILDNLALLFTDPSKILKAYIDFMPLPNNQGAVKKALGGYISGPGTETSDSIPALLSNGEFVVNANATAKNRDLLERMNNSSGIQRFAKGGIALAPDKFYMNARMAGGKYAPETLGGSDVYSGENKMSAYLALAISRARLAGVTITDEDARNLLKTAAVEGRHDYGNNGVMLRRGTDSLGNKYTDLKDSHLDLYNKTHNSTIKSIDKLPNYGIDSQSITEQYDTYKFLYDMYRKGDLTKDLLKSFHTRLSTQVLLSFYDTFKSPFKNIEEFAKKYPESKIESLLTASSNLPLGGSQEAADDFLFTVLVKQQQTGYKSISKMLEAGLYNGQGKAKRNVTDSSTPNSKQYVQKLKALDIPENTPMFDYFASMLGATDLRDIRLPASMYRDPLALASRIGGHQYGSQPIGPTVDTMGNGKASSVAIPENMFKYESPIESLVNSLKRVFGYAAGGRIEGPGSSTSDSIPAMLSNGEFVVNAEATKRNFAILDAINNGKNVRRFAKGGIASLDKQIVDMVDSAAIANGIESALVKAVIMVESAGNATAKSHAGAVGLMQLTESTARDLKLVVTSTKDERLDAAKNIAAGTEYLKQQIKTFGTLDKALAAYNWGPRRLARNLDANGEIIRLPQETKDYIEAVRMHAGLPKMDKDYETFGVSRSSKSPWRGRTNQIEGNAIGGGVDWSVFPFGIGDRLAKIDFSKWPGGELIVEAFSWIAKTFLNKAKIATDALDVLGGTREEAAKAINSIGFEKQYKGSDFNKLSKGDLDAIRGAVSVINAPKSPANDLEELADDAAVKAARATITTILSKTEKPKSFSDKVNSGSTIQAIEALNESFRGNTQYLLGLTAYSKLSADDINRLVSIATTTEDLNQRMVNMSEFERSNALKLSAELWKHADEILSRVNAPTSGAYVSRPSADALKAGTTFATSFQNEFTAALAQVLKGKERFSSLGKFILERITGGILDNLSKGFVDSFFAKTDLGDKLSKMITSIFTFGEKSGGGLGNFANSIAEAFRGPPVTHGNVIDPEDAASYPGANIYSKSATSDYEQTFSYDFSSLKSSVDKGLSNVVNSVDTSGSDMLKGITGIGSFLSTVLGSIGGGAAALTKGIGSGISNFFSSVAMPWLEVGFATGGPVSGPGTGTSDSIPALLSSGEFVINARATSRYRSLLESINSGSLPHFASGGFVANSSDIGNLGVKSVSKRNSATEPSSTSIFNINITGDISNQTRKQVLSMIPEIAAGTNAHNREINYNRR